MTVATRATLAVVLTAVVGGCTPVDWPDDPEAAAFVTEDLPRFWSAVDEGATASALQRTYLDPGTTGLRAMQARRIGSPEELARAVDSWRPWYDAIRPAVLGLHDDSAWQDAVRTGFRAAKAQWPEAFFPTTTVLVGRFNSAGTADPEAGLLLGAEFFAPADGGPTEGLDPWRQSVVQPVSSLPTIVAHEHVHLLQAALCDRPRDSDPLLAWVLSEGVADFLGARWSGAPVASAALAWYLDHEAETWTAFQLEARERLDDRWLFDGGNPGERPPDVGYAIGHRIAEAWWNRSGQGVEAVRGLLTAACDPEGFLEVSGYGPE